MDTRYTQSGSSQGAIPPHTTTNKPETRKESLKMNFISFNLMFSHFLPPPSASSILTSTYPSSRPVRRHRWIALCLMLALALCVASTANAQTTAANEWTWVGGSSTIPTNGQIPGVYGTLGVPATGNIPEDAMAL